ncbi:MAG: succinate dehydrogenase, cytochrome b556 subunit [Thermoplasmata archaeon]
MGLKEAFKNWLDYRGRHIHGGIAYLFHRLTGLIILLYLYVHFGALSQLLNGGESYKNFLATVESPPFVALDILLFFVIFYHGANGIRLVFNEFGIGTKKNKLFFWIMMVLGLIGWLLLTYLVATKFIGGG